MRRAALAVTILSLLTLPTWSAPSDAVALQQRPEISITSPADGARLEGPDVTVTLEVEGVELTSRRSGAGAHVLLRLDDTPPVKSFAEQFTFQQVPAGDHLVRAELRHTDGSPFSPPLRAQVRFTVRAASP